MDMNKELGVWTHEDCALVLIDYQQEMFEVIRSETGAELVELHVRLLARTAKAFGMPIVGVVQDGYDVLFVTDAVGGRSQVAHRTGIERLAHAGGVPTTALAVTTELFRDWATPLAAPALDVIHWYFTEVPKLTDAVGVAEAEKRAAAAALQGATS
jgi:hypothetical protein